MRSDSYLAVLRRPVVVVPEAAGAVCSEGSHAQTCSYPDRHGQRETLWQLYTTLTASMAVLVCLALCNLEASLCSMLGVRRQSSLIRSRRCSVLPPPEPELMNNATLRSRVTLIILPPARTRPTRASGLSHLCHRRVWCSTRVHEMDKQRPPLKDLIVSVLNCKVFLFVTQHCLSSFTDERSKNP